MKRGTLKNFRTKHFERLLFFLWEKHVCINENHFHIYALKIFSLRSSFNERHFSHETKSRIFENLNLRKQADRNFRGNFRKKKKHFRHLKLFSNTPSWLARSRCHMGTFWKTKDCSLHFWESQPFRFWYVEVHCQRRLNSTRTGISSQLKKNLFYFLWGKVYIKKFCRVKARAFYFKN